MSVKDGLSVWNQDMDSKHTMVMGYERRMNRGEWSGSSSPNCDRSEYTSSSAWEISRVFLSIWSVRFVCLSCEPLLYYEGAVRVHITA